MRVVIGIDPGAGGGIGVIFVGTITGSVVGRNTIKMPATEEDLVSLFQRAKEEDPAIFMEKVHAMPCFFKRNGKPARNGIVSMFSFGQQVGSIKTALAAAGLLDRVQFINPQEWQRELECLTKGDKKVSKKAAETMFPNLKITHATADALLIAEYGRRVVLGEITRHENASVARTSRKASKGKSKDRKANISTNAKCVAGTRKALSRLKANRRSNAA